MSDAPGITINRKQLHSKPDAMKRSPREQSAQNEANQARIYAAVHPPAPAPDPARRIPVAVRVSARHDEWNLGEGT